MPITLGGHCIGSVAIQAGILSDPALHALPNLIAITLENARSRDIATRAQAARQSEEFKSTLLDGLAHEFKTPLTSIKAATSALLAANVLSIARDILVAHGGDVRLDSSSERGTEFVMMLPIQTKVLR